MTTDVSWDISDLRKMATDNASHRNDVWGPPAAGMFGKYPMPDVRGTTPWSTSNAEYGRWMRGLRGEGEGEGADGETPWDQLQCGGEFSGGGDQGLDGTQPDATYGYYAAGNAQETTAADADAAAAKPRPNIPSANDDRYLLASRPMQSYEAETTENDAAVQARQDLKTGAGKRFMIQECNRFWDNMKSLSSEQQGGGQQTKYSWEGDQQSGGQPKYSWEGDTQVLKIDDDGQGDASYDFCGQSNYEPYGDTQKY